MRRSPRRDARGSGISEGGPVTGPTNKVKLGFFSFTEVTDPGQHRAYNEWHQLDHMPEQHPCVASPQA